MKRLALVTFTTLVSAGSAHADEREDKINQLKNQLGEFDYAVKKIEKQEEGLSGGAGYFRRPVSDCTAIIDQLKALGVGPTEDVWGWPFKKAPEKCERYGKIQALTATFETIDKTQSVWSRIHDKQPGDAGATMWSGEAVTRGKACVEAINQAEANGAPMDVVLRGIDKTAADTRTWCEDVIKRGAALEGASADADAAHEKQRRERYTKLGAAGDRLEWLLNADPGGRGAVWSLPPTCDRSDDVKKQVKSKVLMKWYDNPDRTVTIQKLTFKGNKLVKEQTKTFDTKAKAYKFCK